MSKSKPAFILSLLIFLSLTFNSLSFAQETLTITTYYPSPYGSYNELETGTLYFNEGSDGLISFKYPDTTYDRRLRITAGRADTVDNDQGASIDLYGNTAPPGGELHLVAGRNSNIVFWTSPTGSSYQARMYILSDGNVGIGTTGPMLGPLQMGSGAYVTFGGAWTDASSRAYKQDIAPLSLDKAMKTLIGLQPITFRYKRAPDEQHVGFISEDVPELVATKDRTGLSTMDIVAVLTKAVQQQQKEIENLKQEVSRLKRAL